MTLNPVFWIRKLFATCLLTGYIPFAPGSIGAAITVILLYFFQDTFHFFLGPEHFLRYWGIIIILIAICFFLTAKAKEVFGKEDPPQVTFDEFVGQFITFFMVPLSIRTLVLGFALFRFFDIVKPFPVHVMEEMEGGVGVTMDDVAAGVLANITLIAILGTFNWIMGML
ncbi:phosphatidylglycerophosphatase A [Chitinispirillales bacterium ANBcel5]|uniref:phosphatidylglycerophosphatase A family protein n=1 Tax=Cellulosispirillum alkaliphilum TaxID=3039283 RepID=UPI002A5920C7|nr:phosphatidylglycerophosphatase A [Chitinispirillales bacterium ANBcel5]